MVKRYSLSFFLCGFLLLSTTTFSQTLNLPTRNPLAKNGTQIVTLLTPLSLTAREDSIYHQVITGNVPDFMRSLVAVKDTEIINSTSYIIIYYVLPDYLALGCDSNYFLCPMTPLLAQKLADSTGCSLPTRKMVNQIWKQASLKLAPQTISPSGQMITVPVFNDHNNMVWSSRTAQLVAHPLGELVGGDKKDVVISNLIYGYPSPGRVVIYGWHQLNGSPIQPLYNGHEETYADYSHGIRLVQNNVTVNGSVTNIQSILSSSTLNVLLSDEGAIATPRYPDYAVVLSKPSSFCVLDSAQGIISVKVLANSDVQGYNVLLSRDGVLFDTPVYYGGNHFTIEGLNPDTLYYLKLSAIGYTNNSSPYSEVLAATTFGNLYPESQWMIINAFDRATAGNSYDFVRQHASAIFQCASFPVSSATNEAMCDSLILLSDYIAVDYILGEESSVNETFTAEEQEIITAYHTPHKPLFVSGSEIAWDLDHLGSTSDKAFFNNVLHASYIEDAPNNTASTYYEFNTPTSVFQFDDGSHGTYDVRYPDVVSLFSQPSTTMNNLGFYTGFTSKYAGTWEKYSLVYLAIPFETIYPESARCEFMNWVNEVFFLMDNNSEILTEKILVYPNPATDILYLEVPENYGSAIVLKIKDITGKTVLSETNLLQNTKNSISLERLSNGIYIVEIQTTNELITRKIIISKN